MHRTLPALFLILGYALRSVSSLALSFNGFQQWSWASAIVVGDWLYIDGGVLWSTAADASKPPEMANNNTFAIDLRKSWMTSTVEAVVNAKTIPTFGRPNLWYSRKTNTVYSYGGNPNKDVHVDKATCYSFVPNGRGSVTWQPAFTAGDGSTFSPLVATVGALAAASDSVWYGLGGHISSTSDPQFVGLGTYRPFVTGLVSFDFETSRWSNQSIDSGDAFKSEGDSQYIPTYGVNGVLLYFGGKSMSTATLDQPNAPLVPMNIITIYDIQSRKFYTQNTTGTAPSIRYGLCSVAAASADNATYEIFVYGGIQQNGTMYDAGTVYILTLPAFHWTALTDLESHPRYAHTCKQVGNSQMLVIGGYIDTAIDTVPTALNILNMNTLSWTNTFTPNAPMYQRPAIVASYYRNKSNSFYPASWSSPALKTIFNASSTPPTLYDSSQNRTGGSSPSPTQSATPQPQTQKSKTGMIAGIIVGTILVILILGAVLLLLSRRQRQQRQTARGTAMMVQQHASPYAVYEKRPSELPSGIVATELPERVHRAELPTRSHATELP